MANEKPVKGENLPPEQQNDEGQPSAAKEGESVLSESDLHRDITEKVLPLTPEEEIERQGRENYPRARGYEFAGQHDEWEGSTYGAAASDRSMIGRVVVVDYDCEVNGKAFKAGVQDLHREDADAIIAEGLGFEPAGKKLGR